MARIEFYMHEGDLWYLDDRGHNEMVGQNSPVIGEVLSIIRDRYPEAYKALQERYKDSAPNRLYFRYVIVKRFIKCNFGNLDSTSFDIDGDKVNFERVVCPLRMECKYDGVICSPLFKTSLTSQELRIGRLWYEGLSKDEIAGLLFLSPETVNSHIRNIYRKLGIHEKAEFVRYAASNGLFNHEDNKEEPTHRR